MCIEFAEKMVALGVQGWRYPWGSPMLHNGRAVKGGYELGHSIGCGEERVEVRWLVSADGVLYHCQPELTDGAHCRHLARVDTWDALDALGAEFGTEGVLLYDDMWRAMQDCLESAAYSHWNSQCRDAKGRFKKSA